MKHHEPLNCHKSKVIDSFKVNPGEKDLYVHDLGMLVGYRFGSIPGGAATISRKPLHLVRQFQWLVNGFEYSNGHSNHSTSIPSSAIKHGWLENGPFTGAFPIKPPFSSGMFQPYLMTPEGTPCSKQLFLPLALVRYQDDMRIFSLRPDVANIANPESGRPPGSPPPRSPNEKMSGEMEDCEAKSSEQTWFAGTIPRKCIDFQLWT